MRCVGRHLHALLLFLCISSSLSFCEDFSGCFPSERLERFWLSQGYIQGNPLIMRLLVFNIYAFPFSGSLESLGIEDAEIMGGADFSRSLPDGGKGFEQSSASLDSAAASLSCAKDSLYRAQSLSKAAKASIETSFGVASIPQNGLVHGWMVEPAMRIADFASYAMDFEQAYFGALTCTADAFDFVNDAGRAASAKAQSEYERLGLAGAGSDAYSGSAKEAYLYARSFLFSGGACEGARESSSGALSYFRQFPPLPNYAPINMPSYFNSTSGGTGSTIARIAGLAAMLSSAHEAMELEYQTELLEAKSAEKRLSGEVESLSREELSLIGDSPSSPEPAGTITVGMGYGGIESAWKQASLDLARAQDEISLAEAARKSQAQNHLALAISRAKASYAIAENARAAAGAARADAASAVSFRKSNAQAAISRAESAKAESSPGSLPSAQAYSGAALLLDQAKGAFSSAERAMQLGRRYSGFAQSEWLADQSYLEFKGESKAQSLQGAADAVDSLERLSDNAEKDGLDVSYEKGRAAQYRALLSAKYSPALSAAISSSAKADIGSLSLRLYAEYSPLEAEYANAVSVSRSLASAGEGEACNLGEVSSLFPSGKLDALNGAGKLAKAKRALLECRSEMAKRIPSALSAVLSKNAEVHELSETPLLGMPTLYEAEISTSNPTGLSHLGKVGFLASTTNPLYSSEFSGGDTPSDAYPDGVKTRIVLPQVLQNEKFSLRFKKMVQPAQRTGSSESCLQADQHSASMRREILFFATRGAILLSVAEQAPPLSHSGWLSYNGERTPADAFESESSSTLTGAILNVPEGKGSVLLEYGIRAPFEAAISGISFDSLPMGAKRASLAVEISNAKADCANAEAAIHLPYSGISNLSVACTQGCSDAPQFSTENLPNSTELRVKARLLRGMEKRIAINFVLEDPSAALSEALLLAERQVAAFNRTSDSLLLSEAKALASANRTSDALAVLSEMRQGAGELSMQRADFAQYSGEKSSLSEKLSGLSSIRDSLLSQNFTEAASLLSTPLYKCVASLEAADSESGAEPLRALSSLRKAKFALSSSLAEASWGYISGVSDKVAKAKKSSGSQALSQASALLFEAERLYAQGDFASALLPAAKASGAVLGALLEGVAEQSSAALLSEGIRQKYAALRQSTGELLTSYSAQYASISAQGKRKLPITPSEAEKAISEAEKGFASSGKAGASPFDSLALANSSYQKLSSTADLLSSAMESLEQSAKSSLAVARAALAEAKAKAGESGKQDVASLEKEVENASWLFSSGQYGESLASSDRAIKAANLVLAGAPGEIDSKAVLLGAASLAFIAAAAYYFFRQQKKSPQPEKKEVKKAESPPGA